MNSFIKFGFSYTGSVTNGRTVYTILDNTKTIREIACRTTGFYFYEMCAYNIFLNNKINFKNIRQISIAYSIFTGHDQYSTVEKTLNVE